MGIEEANGLFSQTEKDRLESNYQYRKKMVEFAFREGSVPDSAKDIEAINQVLNSMDKAIYDKANAAIKYQDTQNKAAVLDTVSEALKNIQVQKMQHVNDEKLLELNETPLDIVKGELELGVNPITLGEIMSEEEEN